MANIGELSDTIPALEDGIPSLPELGNLDCETEVPKRKRNYKFRDRRLLEVARTISDEKFQTYFRMTRETFSDLLDLVKVHLPDGRSTNGRSLLTEEKLLCFLMHIAGNLLTWTEEVGTIVKKPLLEINNHGCF